MTLEIDQIVEYGELLAGRMHAIQSVAIDAALSAGDEEVAVPGKTGARQFDIAAHAVLTALAELVPVGDVDHVHVLTEETPWLAARTAELQEMVEEDPGASRLVYLFDPVDGSMQYLKAGVGWCTAGLATAWFPSERRWDLLWAGVMTPGGRDAVWLPGGRSRPQPDFVETNVDTVAVNDFKVRNRGAEILNAVGNLPWVDFRLSSGGNPIAVAIVGRSETVMVQPMASMPHDTIGTLILASLDNDVYDLNDTSGEPVETSTIMSWFANPTRCHDKDLVPAHVVGPPGAAREVWDIASPIMRLGRTRRAV